MPPQRHTPPPSLLVALAGVTLACAPPDLGSLPPLCDPRVETCPPGATSSSSGTTSDEPPPSGDVQTVTSATTSTEPEGTTSSGATTSEPEVIPAIHAVEFTPNPLTLAGAITVDVTAEHADGVRMQIMGADPVELVEGPDGHFTTEITVYTGLSNGTYSATFRSRNGDDDGDPVPAEYTVALSAAGSEMLWDVWPDLGHGTVQSLRVTPSGKMIAFGTYNDGNETRCFLHRRDLDGKYLAGDAVTLYPDYSCSALDLQVRDDDTLVLLASVIGGDGARWRLGSMKWGDPLTVLRTGAKDDIAHALALDPAGQPFVCGSGPTLLKDTDARVWGPIGPPREYDYQPTVPNLFPPHSFDEALKDCTFAGDRLVLLGEVIGQHDKDPNNPVPPLRRRLLLLEDDPQDGVHWTVQSLGPGNATQSSGTALALDDQGRYLVGLYTCADDCDAEAEIRVYEPGGALSDVIPLQPNVLAPQELAWSPAGYIVMASAISDDPWTSRFFVQAFTPGKLDPAWAYEKADPGGLLVAYTTATVSGRVLAAGAGEGGFPTLLLLYP